jgi:hypothetical protein
MKTIAKILAAILGSCLLALGWWALLPSPPFPDELLIVLAPVAKSITSEVPEVMEVLAFLYIWLYVVLAALVVWIALGAISKVCRRQDSNNQFQRTPSGAAEQ